MTFAQILITIFYSLPLSLTVYLLLSRLADLSRPSEEELLLNHSEVLADPYTKIYADTIREKLGLA